MHNSAKSIFFEILESFSSNLINSSASRLDPISFFDLFSSMLKLQASLILINSDHLSCNLEFKNFNITEQGDLRDIVDFRNTGGDLVQTNQTEIPSFDDL